MNNQISNQSKLTRRQALLSGAGLAAALSSNGAFAANGSKSLKIGMATLEFRQLTNRQLAKELAKQNINVVQLFLTQSDSNYWKYNQAVDVSDLTPDRCHRIVGDYRNEGVDIHSIGVYANLIHPDGKIREENMAYFEAMFKIGGHMGVKTFISEAGHFRPKDDGNSVEYHFREDVWRMMVDTGKKLAAVAERYDAVVLLEPFFMGFLATAKRTRMFIEEIGSPRIRALLDPANLLEMNDLNEMFDQLQPYIDCMHAKDRKYHVARGVPAGKGDLDYLEMVTLAAERTPNAPLILEYVGPDTYLQALSHLREAMKKANIKEA